MSIRVWENIHKIIPGMRGLICDCFTDAVVYFIGTTNWFLQDKQCATEICDCCGNLLLMSNFTEWLVVALQRDWQLYDALFQLSPHREELSTDM